MTNTDATDALKKKKESGQLVYEFIIANNRRLKPKNGTSWQFGIREFRSFILQSEKYTII